MRPPMGDFSQGLFQTLAETTGQALATLMGRPNL